MHALTRPRRQVIIYLSCAGTGSPAIAGQVSDTIDWCGAEYSLDDLKGALALLLPQDTPEDQLLAQQYSDPWAPATWEVYSDSALLLLKALAECQTAPQVATHRLCHALL